MQSDSSSIPGWDPIKDTVESIPRAKRSACDSCILMEPKVSRLSFSIRCLAIIFGAECT